MQSRDALWGREAGKQWEVWTVTPAGTCPQALWILPDLRSHMGHGDAVHTKLTHTHTHTVFHPLPYTKPSFPADIYAVSLFNVARLRLWWLLAAPSPCVLVFPFDKARGERKSASPTPRRRPRVPVGGVFLTAAVATTCDSRSTWQERASW